MATPHFTNIKQQIKSQLAYAQSSVYVAVAWFTDKELFSILCDLIEKNHISVNLLITEDEINNNAGIDFEKINILGGHFYSLDTSANGNYAKMHNKFCVIDEKTTIIGSYNWTYNAQNNHESVVIIEDEPATAIDCIEEFYKLVNANPQNKAINFVYSRGIILRNALLENNSKSIENALAKFSDVCEKNNSLAINKISKSVLENKYNEAINELDKLLSEWQSIVIYIDPKIAILQAEIKSLEIIIEVLTAQKGNLEQKVYQFNIQYYQQLGSIIKEILALELQLKEDNNQQETNQYKQTKEQYNQFNDALNEANKIEINTLDEDVKAELKKLYNKAVKLCHPDKYQLQSEKDIVNEWFVKLNEANQKNDIDTVRQILFDLENKNFNKLTDSNSITSIEELEKRVTYLSKTKSEIENEILSISNSVPVEIVLNELSWKNYFENQLNLLSTKLQSLKASCQPKS